MAYQFSNQSDATLKFQGITNDAWNIGKVSGAATADQTVSGVQGLLYMTDMINDYNVADLLRTLKQSVQTV